MRHNPHRMRQQGPHTAWVGNTKIQTRFVTIRADEVADVISTSSVAPSERASRYLILKTISILKILRPELMFLHGLVVDILLNLGHDLIVWHGLNSAKLCEQQFDDIFCVNNATPNCVTTTSRLCAILWLSLEREKS